MTTTKMLPLDAFFSVGIQYWLFNLTLLSDPVQIGDSLEVLHERDRTRDALQQAFDFASVTGYWA